MQLSKIYIYIFSLVCNVFLLIFLQEHESQIRAFLPGNDFSNMTAVLKKFYNFMNLTASVSI